MQHRSSIYIYKLFSRYPLQTSSKVKSFPLRSLPKIPNQWISKAAFPTKLEETHPFIHPTSPYTSTQFRISQNVRRYSVDTDKEIAEMKLKLAEATEQLDMALESKKLAKEELDRAVIRSNNALVAAKEFGDMFAAVWAKLTDKEKEELEKSMFHKIRKWRAGLKQLSE